MELYYARNDSSSKHSSTDIKQAIQNKNNKKTKHALLHNTANKTKRQIQRRLCLISTNKMVLYRAQISFLHLINKSHHTSFNLTIRFIDSIMKISLCMMQNWSDTIEKRKLTLASKSKRSKPFQ